MFDPLHLAIAIAPVGCYLLAIGRVRWAARPKIVSGVNDTVWLGIAISGLVVAGPFELFMPEAAAARFHGFIWLLLLGLYAMLVTLLALLLRPRIVIYNVSSDALRPALSEVVGQIDREARWAGQGVVLPTLGVQFSIEPDLPLRTAQLVAAGSQQSYAGWRQLEQALRQALQSRPGVRGGHAGLLMAAGSALLITAALTVGMHWEETTVAWRIFLRQ